MTVPDADDIPRPAPSGPDRAQAAGLPPDSGPEKQVLVLRPSLARSHPFMFLVLALAPIAGGILLPILGAVALPVALIAAGIVALICWGILLVWWLNFSVATSLEITNKRTILHLGLLSRSTTEVLHDHIRNIQIRQTFAQRILGVGSIGLSSAADAAIEIQMSGIPDPYRLRKVIDLYRPLG